MLTLNNRGTTRAIVVSGSWHVRAPDGELINLNSREGADLILGLWETIDALEHRDIKKTRRRSRKKVEEEEDIDL